MSVQNCYTCKHCRTMKERCVNCEVLTPYQGDERCPHCGKLKFETESLFQNWEACE